MPDALAQWLDEMEAHAKDATPGPWEVREFEDDGWAVGGNVGLPDNQRWWIAYADSGGDERAEGNAAHIAAWSPDVARAVLAVVRAVGKVESHSPFDAKVS